MKQDKYSTLNKINRFGRGMVGLIRPTLVYIILSSYINSYIMIPSTGTPGSKIFGIRDAFSAAAYAPGAIPCICAIVSTYSLESSVLNYK